MKVDVVQKEAEEALQCFEHWLSQGMLQQVDELLVICDIETLHPATLLAIASITFHAKSQLTQRDAFLVRVEARLVRALGAERAARLLESRR